jgi:hypothetical protein
VLKASTEHLKLYRASSPAKRFDKQEEGRLLDRATDLLCSMEALLLKKYTTPPGAIEAMTDIGLQMRTVFHRLLTETDSGQVHKLFSIIVAAVSDEVRVVDDAMETSQYRVRLSDGSFAYITLQDDGLWQCDRLAVRYKEPVYAVGALEGLGLLNK